MSVRILVGDCRATLATLDAGSVQTCVTSPPYFGLRDYGHAGQIGLEPTPDAYVAELVDVFRAVRRVLADDGTLWLNLGDSYAAGGNGTSPAYQAMRGRSTALAQALPPKKAPAGLKPKDLVGIPWRVAFALQADGWYLRSDIIWHKPNPMPESVTDRPTKAHEYVFLLSKAERYYYDAEAIAETSVDPESHAGLRPRQPETVTEYDQGYDGHRTRVGLKQRAGERYPTRNARSVWSVTTQPYSGAHFATMPPALAERCVKTGSRLGDTVLDPFGGAGTTALVADRLGRHAVLCELNPAYASLAEQRLRDDVGLLADVTVDAA